jgi:methylase of polypeptide subunit release factors
MVEVLRSAGYGVEATDIATGVDFLASSSTDVDAIICNPPYTLAQEFIEHAIELVRPAGFVAMILRCDFDHAACRAHLFKDAPTFCKKVALTKRVRWFANPKTQPSFNHSWFVWDHQHREQPTLAYAP